MIDAAELSSTRRSNAWKAGVRSCGRDFPETDNENWLAANIMTRPTMVIDSTNSLTTCRSFSPDFVRRRQSSTVPW